MRTVLVLGHWEFKSYVLISNQFHIPHPIPFHIEPVWYVYIVEHVWYVHMYIEHVLETLNSNVITLLTFVFLHYTTGVEGEVKTVTGTVLKLESESESESMPVGLISCDVMWEVSLLSIWSWSWSELRMIMINCI